jgi:KAP-like P-loop domain-containing protein
MKHFFAVPKVHFVLGANLDQLRNSISVAYGSTIDAQMYLQKFIQLTMFLVDQGQYHHERVTTKFLNHLIRVLEFKQEHIELVQEAAAVFRHAAEHRNLSLRAIEQMMTYKPQNALCPGCILGGLCVMRVTSPELFAKAKAGTLNSKR